MDTVKKNPWAIGTRYGQWTILDGQFHGRKILAGCTCGTTKHVDRHKLTNGTTTSCGHTNPRTGRTWKITAPRNDQSIDIGTIHGRLTITGTPIPGKDRTIPTRCTCGTEKNIIIRYILNGRIKSCGCLRTEGIATLHHKQ